MAVEQRPGGYLVLNGELLKGPFNYEITDAHEALVNGRRIHPRVSRFPSDQTDDYEITDIRIRESQNENASPRSRELAELHVEVVGERRAVSALASIDHTLNHGMSRVIMESEGAELSFSDPEGTTQNRIKEILGTGLPDHEKVEKVDRLFPTLKGIGIAVVANAASWM